MAARKTANAETKERITGSTDEAGLEAIATNSSYPFTKRRDAVRNLRRQPLIELLARTDRAMHIRVIAAYMVENPISLMEIISDREEHIRVRASAAFKLHNMMRS